MRRYPNLHWTLGLNMAWLTITGQILPCQHDALNITISRFLKLNNRISGPKLEWKILSAKNDSNAKPFFKQTQSDHFNIQNDVNLWSRNEHGHTSHEESAQRRRMSLGDHARSSRELFASCWIAASNWARSRRKLTLFYFKVITVWKTE